MASTTPPSSSSASTSKARNSSTPRRCHSSRLPAWPLPLIFTPQRGKRWQRSRCRSSPRRCFSGSRRSRSRPPDAALAAPWPATACDPASRSSCGAAASSRTFPPRSAALCMGRPSTTAAARPERAARLRRWCWAEGTPRSSGSSYSARKPSSRSPATTWYSSLSPRARALRGGRSSRRGALASWCGTSAPFARCASAGAPPRSRCGRPSPWLRASAAS
mmetsp:Transcript_63094/g.205901  ORF Transcript_63094/g.205901 Transcript_63094/m.205901 type:complete len:219 (-) Transcript_63094:670-1326(-)